MKTSTSATTKKIAIIFFVTLFNIGCASLSTNIPTQSAGNIAQVNNKDYPDFINQSMSYANNLSDDIPAPSNNLEFNDLDISFLLLADLLNYQQKYNYSYEFYDYLNSKYHDPRLDYQSILAALQLPITPNAKNTIIKLSKEMVASDKSSSVAGQIITTNLAIHEHKNRLAMNTVDQLLEQTDLMHQRYIVYTLLLLITHSTTLENKADLDIFSYYLSLAYPDIPEVWLLRCYALAYNQSTKELIKQTKQILAINPNWDTPLYFSSTVLLEQNHLDDFADLLYAVIPQLNNPNPFMQELYVDLLLINGDFVTASNYINAHHISAPLKQALVNIKLNNIESAKENLLHTDYHNDSISAILLGSSYEYLGEDSSAIKIYNELSHNPKFTNIANSLLLRVYLNTNNMQKVTQLNDKLMSNKDKATNIFLLAQTYILYNHSELACNLLSKNQELLNSNPNLDSFYATCLFTTKRYDEAFARYESHLQKYPKDIVTYNDYAYSLASATTQYDKALALAQVANKQDPNNYAFQDTLGFIYLKQGNYKLARKLLEQSYNAVADNDTAQHLKDTYIALNETELANKITIRTTQEETQNKLLQDLNLYVDAILQQFNEAPSNVNQKN